MKTTAAVSGLHLLLALSVQLGCAPHAPHDAAQPLGYSAFSPEAASVLLVPFYKHDARDPAQSTALYIFNPHDALTEVHVQAIGEVANGIGMELAPRASRRVTGAQLLGETSFSGGVIINAERPVALVQALGVAPVVPQLAGTSMRSAMRFISVNDFQCSSSGPSSVVAAQATRHLEELSLSFSDGRGETVASYVIRQEVPIGTSLFLDCASVMQEAEHVHVPDVADDFRGTLQLEAQERIAVVSVLYVDGYPRQLTPHTKSKEQVFVPTVWGSSEDGSQTDGSRLDGSAEHVALPHVFRSDESAACQSTVEVTNLAPSSARLSIAYYDRSGTAVLPGAEAFTLKVPARGAAEFSPADNAIRSPFAGAVVINSDVPLDVTVDQRCAQISHTYRGVTFSAEN